MVRSVAEDEFDLVSAWAGIVRWKHFIGVLSVLGLLVGLALSSLTGTVYESQAVLQIGRIGGLGRIQSSAELLQQLGQSDPEHSATAQEIAEGLISVTARGRDPEDTRAYLRAELDKVVRAHEAVFAEASLPKTRARQMLVDRIATSEGQLQASSKRAEVVAPRNPALAAMLAQDQMRLTIELGVLEQRLHALDMELSRVATSPTKVVREPSVPTVSGKRALFFPLVGAAAGLMLGIAAALVLGARPTSAVQPR